jgi:hypothetical protein
MYKGKKMVIKILKRLTMNAYCEATILLTTLILQSGWWLIKQMGSTPSYLGQCVDWLGWPEVLHNRKTRGLDSQIQLRAGEEDNGTEQHKESTNNFYPMVKWSIFQAALA